MAERNAFQLISLYSNLLNLRLNFTLQTMQKIKQSVASASSLWSNLTLHNPLFSIILTTSNNPDLLRINLANIVQILANTESNYEVIIADDSNLEKFAESVQAYKDLFGWLTQIDFPFHYIYTAMFDADGKKDYGLARARNKGICKARGKVLLFLDHRVSPPVTFRKGVTPGLPFRPPASTVAALVH